MTGSEPTTRRERLREQTKTEAKAIALQQLRDGGSSAVSLNAIGRDLGMSGPAMYRYFPGRDDLFTELISDAYLDLAQALQTAAGRDADLSTVAHTFRSWARAQPHRYLLIFGTPIAGYAAPPQTLEYARDVMAVIVRCLPGGSEVAAPPLVAVQIWTRLHGVISLEIEGHFDGMPFSVDELFSAEVSELVALIR